MNRILLFFCHKLKTKVILIPRLIKCQYWEVRQGEVTLKWDAQDCRVLFQRSAHWLTDMSYQCVPKPQPCFYKHKGTPHLCFPPFDQSYLLFYFKGNFKKLDTGLKKNVFHYLLKASKSVLASVWRPAADTGHHTLCSPHTPSHPTALQDRCLHAAGSDRPTSSWGLISSHF